MEGTDLGLIRVGSKVIDSKVWGTEIVEVLIPNSLEKKMIENKFFIYC